jgi:ketosteroid isomerase-like protein
MNVGDARDLEERFRDLDERLRRLEDERAIVRALEAYGQAIDYGDSAMFLGIFTTDAVLDYSGAGRYAGTEEILEFFAAFSAPRSYNKHLVLQPLIEISGEEADVLSSFLFLQKGPDGPVLSHYGRFHDRLVRQPDGSWRIARRQAVGEAV